MTDDAARKRSIESLRNARATVERVIATSQRTAATFPDYRASAEERIAEGEEEIATLDAQIAALERGETFHSVTTSEERLAHAYKVLVDGHEVADRARKSLRSGLPTSPRRDADGST